MIRYCLLAVLLVASWSSYATADAPVTIEIGNLATLEFAKPWLDREIKAFTEKYPHITVKRQPYSEPNRYDHPLHTNPFLPGNIIGLDSTEGAEAAFLAEKGDLVPIESFLPDADFNMDQYYPSYWDAVTHRGKTWGVPWQVWADVLVCDWPLFAEAGIAEPPRTWQEWIDVAQRLTTTGDTPQWGLRVSTYGDTLKNLLITLIIQQDGRVLHNNTLGGDNSIVHSSALLLKELVIDSGAVKLEDRKLVPNGAETERYAMQLVQTPQLTKVLNDPRYRIAPVPGLKETGFMCPRRLYLAVRKSTPEQERASWALIKWLSRADVSIPGQPLGYPCRKDIIRQARFKKVTSGGAMDYEVIFTATANAQDIGAFVLNRSSGLDVWAQSLLPLLMGAPESEAILRGAAQKGNELLVSLPSVRRGEKSLGLFE